MTDLEARIARLEDQVAQLARHPVRDELLSMRDVYGARLDAIETRLRAIERDTQEGTSWLEQRFDDLGQRIDAIARLVGGTS